MLQLRLYRTDFQIPAVPDWVSEGEGVVFFLKNTADFRKIFYSVCFVYPEKWLVSHFYTLTSDNVGYVEYNDREQQYSNIPKIHNPHGIIKTWEHSFIITFEEGRLFHLVDLEKSTVRIYGEKDISFPGLTEIQDMGATAFEDREHPGYFYTTASWKSEIDGTIISHMYRVSFWMESVERVAWEISKLRVLRSKAPHVTRQFGNLLLNSNFSINESFLPATGEHFVGSKKLIVHAYEKLYNLYLERTHQPRIENFIKTHLEKEEGWFFIVNDEWFKEFLAQISYELDAPNFWELMRKIDIKLELSPGHISVLNITNFHQFEFQTTFAAPAHFEILDDKIYVSSHNFMKLDKRYFFGRAGIDRFRIENEDTAILEATFSHPKGFRYTNHRVFYYNNEKYIASIWQPSRLFIVRDDDMSLYDMCDLIPNKLDELEEEELIATHLNRNLTEPCFVGFEVSKNGEHIIAFWSQDIVVYSLKTKDIVMRYDFISLVNDSQRNSTSRYFMMTTHCWLF